MSSSRRELLKSLSRSALVLSLENVLGLARPLWSQIATSKQPTVEPLKPGAPLGVSFVDIGRAAGLNTKTIYGGEHKNKYLLETTGCGVAFYDYDNDGWPDIFLSTGRGWKDSRLGRNRSRTCSRTTATAHLQMSL